MARAVDVRIVRFALVGLALMLASAAGATTVTAASCAGTGGCRDGARLFATPASDGSQMQCSFGQMLVDNPTGPGSICVGGTMAGTTENNLHCLGDIYNYLVSLEGCASNSLVLSPLGNPPLVYPSLPPYVTYVPSQIINASANNFPAGAGGPQGTDLPVDPNAVIALAGPPASHLVPSNPLTIPNSVLPPTPYSSGPSPYPVYSAGNWTDLGPALGQSDLGSLISGALSQFNTANPGLLTGGATSPPTSPVSTPPGGGSSTAP